MWQCHEPAAGNSVAAGSFRGRTMVEVRRDSADSATVQPALRRRVVVFRYQARWPVPGGDCSRRRGVAVRCSHLAPASAASARSSPLLRRNIMGRGTAGARIDRPRRRARRCKGKEVPRLDRRAARTRGRRARPGAHRGLAVKGSRADYWNSDGHTDQPPARGRDTLQALLEPGDAA